VTQSLAQITAQVWAELRAQGVPLTVPPDEPDDLDDLMWDEVERRLAAYESRESG
jgi:hypothetical protein